MSKPDNHLDEFGAIFKDYKLHHKDIDTCFHDHLAELHIARQIEDFYRNKILEAEIKCLKNVIAQWEYPSLAPNWVHERLNDTTAQFNSRGESDE